jgi:hypothetical protein
MSSGRRWAGPDSSICSCGPNRLGPRWTVWLWPGWIPDPCVFATGSNATRTGRCVPSWSRTWTWTWTETDAWRLKAPARALDGGGTGNFPLARGLDRRGHRHNPGHEYASDPASRPRPGRGAGAVGRIGRGPIPSGAAHGPALYAPGRRRLPHQVSLRKRDVQRRIAGGRSGACARLPRRLGAGLSRRQAVRLGSSGPPRFTRGKKRGGRTPESFRPCRTPCAMGWIAVRRTVQGDAAEAAPRWMSDERGEEETTSDAELLSLVEAIDAPQRSACPGCA